MIDLQHYFSLSYSQQFIREQIRLAEIPAIRIQLKGMSMVRGRQQALM